MTISHESGSMRVTYRLDLIPEERSASRPQCRSRWHGPATHRLRLFLGALRVPSVALCDQCTQQARVGARVTGGPL